MLTDLALILLAYLLGSLSFGLLMARMYGGADLRRSGSGNIGATNVARTLGKTAGILTLLGDGAKGLVAVLLAQAWGQAFVVPLLAALWSYPWPLVLTAVLIVLLVLYKHRDNVHRLRQGSEAKFF